MGFMSAKKRQTALRATGEDAFFAASNSERGFFSYYADCFDPPSVERVFVIKGGPGTGKSRFMREVSQCGEAHGWESRMIYCSSDADSLDGVILSKGDVSWAFLDGTAPHVYDPKLPGVREELIDLGAFWNADSLRERRSEIESLNRAKSKGYRMAYRYLSAYGAVDRGRRERVAPFLYREKMRTYGERLLAGVPSEDRFCPQIALIRSVGMLGRVGFDTYLSKASKIFCIQDCRGSGAVFLEELYALAAEKKLKVRISKDPILPDLMDGLLLCESGMAFVIASEGECAYPHRRLSMRKFVNVHGMSGLRASLNFDQRMCRALLDSTLKQMAEVKEAHFALESIYSSAMDFEKKEAFTKSFCNRLFDLQNS